MRNIFLVSLLFFVSFVSNSFSINVEGRQNNREGKVFSLFNIVKFDNDGCDSTEDDTASSNKRYGTCYSSSECSDKGGRSKGSCAAGFGVCCTFIFDDGANRDISENCTYVQNTGYPNAYTGTTGATYSVKKCDDNVCFLRIDFEDFSITGPANSWEYDSDVAWSATAASGGKCNTDKMVVTAPSSASFAVPTICGQNKGEHIYVPMGTASSDVATIAFTFENDNSRKYDLKLTQIECGDELAPPDGCLQFYSGVSGKIRSFNFMDETPTTHLALQDYSVCMRQEAGYCCIKYTVCDEDATDQKNSFSLFPDISATYTALTSHAIDVSSCTQDYITIEGGKSTCTSGPAAFTQSKFCGSRFQVIGSQAIAKTLSNTPVCSCQSPFVVGIVTDDTADDIIPSDTKASWSRGVCLDFKQQPCV